MKISPRYRNRDGRHKRPTLEQLEAIELATRQIEMSVALAQPHRKNSTDQKRGSALGRFVDDYRALWSDEDDAKASYLAGDKYFWLVHRWRALNEIPESIRIIRENSEVLEEPTREQMDKLRLRIRDADNVMKRYGKIGFVVTFDLCLEERDPHPAHALPVKLALLALAFEFGLLP